MLLLSILFRFYLKSELILMCYVHTIWKYFSFKFTRKENQLSGRRTFAILYYHYALLSTLPYVRYCEPHSTPLCYHVLRS